MKQVPVCPEKLPPEIQEPLRQFSIVWANSALRPVPEKDVLSHWDQLIDQWVNAEDLPLFIRKASLGRGSYLRHPSNRILIPVDNSPPHWSFTQALKGDQPSLTDVRNEIQQDHIPVAMILKKAEKLQASLKHTRTQSENLNHAGWKLAHINSVGLKTRTSVLELPLFVLKDHFRKLMSPSNMFLVPLPLAGLAEMDIMIEEIKKVSTNIKRSECK